MSLYHFVAVYQVEVEKLVRKTLSLVGIALSVLFGLLGVLATWGVNTALVSASVQIQAGPGPGPYFKEPEHIANPQLYDLSHAVYTAFIMRSLLFVPVLIFILGGLVFASELQSRTLREDVLRPVPRWAIMVNKWLALFTWVVGAALATWVPATLGGAVLCGLPSEYLPTMTHLVTTVVTDLGFASLALSIAVFSRSVTATIASLVMIFVVQVGVAVGFSVFTQPVVQQNLEQVLHLPGGLWQRLFESAELLSAWQPPFVLGTLPCLATESAAWPGYLTLTAMIVGSVGAALVRFHRMDVP